MAGDPRQAILEFIERAYADLDQVDNYYLLGVARDATGAEIRRAYYRLAGRLHPDLFGDGLEPALRQKLTTLFSRVVEAYQVLGDGERRARYDQGLAAGKLRWSADEEARPRIRRAEDQVPDGPARKFFRLGQDALLAGNPRAAVMNLELAASMAPDNQTIQDELARAREKAGA